MFAWLTETKEVVGVVLSFVALGTATWKVYAVWRTRNRNRCAEQDAQRTLLHAVCAATKRIEPMLADVQHELKANNGGSLRDQLTGICNELAVDRMARRLLNQSASFEILSLPHDGAHQVLFVSQAFIKLTGLAREDVEDSGWIRCVHPDDKHRVQGEARTAFDDGTVHSTTYTARNVHTGEDVYVEHTGTPVFNTRAALVGWVVLLVPRVYTPHHT